MLNFDKSHAKSLKTLTYQTDYYRPGQFTALFWRGILRFLQYSGRIKKVEKEIYGGEIETNFNYTFQ